MFTSNEGFLTGLKYKLKEISGNRKVQIAAGIMFVLLVISIVRGCL